uniref:EOG090X01R1 n=1 Tax=Daphnia barbata TaxID=414587 RepID=A0A4Y7M090_9CRUS|nr:EOG090X01R1 [Daphnia barbata]
MESGGFGKAQKPPKVAKVKNKTPAEIQITAEQLLREAKERDLEIVPPPPKQKISDPDELADYQYKKRKTFEDALRRNRNVITNWIKYAQWEESQKEIQRARSVFERALDVDHRNITLWLKYSEMEMKNKQVNHARNLWDRAVTILPRANQFWYKYTYMEEMLVNIAGCRQVFERWMEWQPDEQAWQTYINFELRYKELDRARSIFERFVYVHPEVKNWIKFAKFEERNGCIIGARQVYERAVDFYGDDHMDERLFIAFAKFEEGQKEHERATAIYKFALEHMSKDKAADLYKAYTIHQKKFGERDAIEDVIVSKRKFQYEQEIKENPSNYDAWFDYLRLLESEGDADIDVVRDTYERAIANIPLVAEKSFWRRYIYLWINYALFEELEAEDYEKTRQVYDSCLKLIPHRNFTFAKMWLLYAHFEVRQKNLQLARRILGTAIGKCPKNKLFRGYIDLEIQLREFDRCRTLYEKFLQNGPENCTTWMKFAELETLLGDIDRARGIYELAIKQPLLDMPEILWKAYIDFEIEQEESEKARALYERLLERTQHVKVWMSFAQFELTLAASRQEDLSLPVTAARAVFQRANKSLRSIAQSAGLEVATNKEERLMLLEAWQEFEYEHGDEASRNAVVNLMPRRVKKRRRIQTQDGSDAGWEEYFDYIFPEDEATKPNLKLLAMAKAWKMAKESTPASEEKDTTKINAPTTDTVAYSMSSSALSTQQLLSQDDDRDDSSESSGSDSSGEEN